MQEIKKHGKNIYQVIALIVAAAVVVYFSLLFLDIIIMLVISLLIAMILNPVVRFLESNNLPRGLAVMLVFLLTAFTIFIGLYILIPKIIGQFNALAHTFSKDKINMILGDFETTLKENLPFIDTEGILTRLSDFVSGLFVQSINNLSKIVSSIVSVMAISIIVPFMTYFILRDNDKIVKGILNVMPNKYFEMVYLVIFKIRIQLGRFVRGWLLDAASVGILSAVGLSILGIQNSITIGIIAGLGHLIPYFGPIIGGIPAIIISVTQFGDLSMLPSIIVMFLIVYAMDNGFIQPNVFSKSTDMHPLIIIILVLAGSQIMGVLGMLLAVPIATVVRTASKEIYLGYKNYKILKI
ncbi:MAG: AI-2E family transporter [Chlorobi bacterium]|nr:AI-2E family transporter [Chlorobiota bacterium]